MEVSCPKTERCDLIDSDLYCVLASQPGTLNLLSLKCYKERHGHCNVPVKWSESPKLGTWVLIQRVQKRKGAISAERKARLDALGFDWNPRPNKRRTG
jgi:hypothetical protein